VRAHHEQGLLARESSRRRDAVAHPAPAGHKPLWLGGLLATIALLIALIMIAVVLAA
jgi:hypothetical protein